jgi:hypothetical protein
MHGIEVAAVFLRDFHHVEVNMRTLVTGKANERYLSCLLGTNAREAGLFITNAFCL